MNGTSLSPCTTAEFEMVHFGVGEIRFLLVAQLDDAGADVAAAYIDRKNAVVSAEYPGGNQVDAADQPGVIRHMSRRKRRITEANSCANSSMAL